MMDDYMVGKDQNLIDNWNSISEEYGFTDGVPKDALYVKFTPGTTYD